MEKLEIKHLAPYLPYKVRIQTKDKKGLLIKTVDGIYKQYSDGSFMLYWEENYGTIQASGGIKLILRPLSDLTKEITVNGETFVPLHKFYSLTSVDLELIDVEEWREELVYLIKNNSPFQLSQFNMLLEWHFDIFSLCDKGLAIDINTLKI